MTTSEQLQFDQAIADYGAILAAVEDQKTPLSLDNILELLRKRDEVETLLKKGCEGSGKSLGVLVDCDRRLRNLATLIAEGDHLTDCRQTFNPPETSWWWFLKPPIPSHAIKLVRFNWLWNVLTVACLVGTGTFATNTIQAFSQGGMDLLQLFGTISQGAGLVFVSGGALTDKGKESIRKVLSSLKIGPHYQAQATLGLAVIALVSTYGIYSSLPSLGEYYYRKGNQFYNSGELARAKQSYEEATNFKPDDPEIRVALGNIYETVEEYDSAKNEYQLGLFQGDPAALNGLGRTLVRLAKNSQDLVTAEINFRLALSQPEVDPILRSELHTHLGLALIKQAENSALSPTQVEVLRNEAESSLTTAIDLESTIPPKSVSGIGMSHCYLAIVLQQQGDDVRAAQSWQNCEENALPTSIGQYEDIIRYGGFQVAAKIDTSRILSEDESLRLEDQQENP